MSDTEVEHDLRRAWTWFPTADGAVARSAVLSFSLERIDGEFKGGHASQWTVTLHGPELGDGVVLRPRFHDPHELCAWIDLVFPGASFALLPPGVVAESPDWVPPADPLPEGVRAVGQFGSGTADAIREIGDGLAGGNAYEPDQGYRPPPGAPPRMI